MSVANLDPSNDPEFFDQPDKFQPMRFYDKATVSGGDGREYQLSATGGHVYNFGYGNKACPGRYFASAELKLIWAYLLSNFDFRFPTGQTERPKNVAIDTDIKADQNQKVEIRERFRKV
jgi:ent-kaurene oxidase